MPPLPGRVTVYEVGPRDGLQNEAALVPTEVKVEFIERLAEAGLPAVEATSFVSARAIPQLADSSEVFRSIRRNTGTRYPVLVPNLKGYEAAFAAGAQEVAIFTAASESFNRKNIGCGITESFERFRPVAEATIRDGLALRGYVSTAFFCPYEGAIAPEKATDVIVKMLEAGAVEVSIGDTIGAAVPTHVHRLLAEIESRHIPLGSIALHFHDTRGTALANVLAGLEHGIATFDSSTGGLGGCPFAPGASGNLPTEDLLFLLEGMGIETGVDLEKVREASQFIARHLGGRILPSHVLAAGRFIPRGRLTDSDR